MFCDVNRGGYNLLDFQVMNIRTILFCLICVVIVTACGNNEPVPTAVPPASVDQPNPSATANLLLPPAATAVPTPIPPTPTPSEPLAALVNGEPVFLAAYEKELTRYENTLAEMGTVDDTRNYRHVVLDALIKQILVVQAASEAGIVITDEMVEAALNEYRTLAGEAGNFEAWLEANSWTEEEYRAVIAAELAETQIVERVTEDVPFATEQIRARYLQTADAALADALLVQIQDGEDFAALAQQYSADRVTGEYGGDMGYFMRNSLLVPALEDAAFALQPGEVSNVITAASVDGSQTMYYIVQVIERDPQRPLPADLRYELLQQTFQTWLDSLWQQAEIERLIDIDA
jgi:parvulin-like peptidyl-prolyl isomerase